MDGNTIHTSSLAAHGSEGTLEWGWGEGGGGKMLVDSSDSKQVTLVFFRGTKGLIR